MQTLAERSSWMTQEIVATTPLAQSTVSQQPMIGLINKIGAHAP